MIRKIIFLCVRYRIRIFSKLFHSAQLLWGIIQSGCNLSYRSPILYNWAITYVPYIQSDAWKDTLYQGLSAEDVQMIDGILEKILYIAYHNVVDYRKLYSENDEKEQQEYLRYFYEQSESNYFKKNGYGLMNEYCIHRDVSRFGLILEGKDIVDCGAYIGDSAIAFSNTFPDSKIYALEPNSHTIDKLTEVISLHGKVDQIIPLNVGVGTKDMQGYISDEGIASKVTTKGLPIKIRSIDSLVDELGLKPGLIKWDIEGFEYASILGCISTLKKYKPILFISIYHHGRDLFEVKKTIQDLDIGYKFTFTRRDSMTPFADTLLVCH